MVQDLLSPRTSFLQPYYHSRNCVTLTSRAEGPSQRLPALQRPLSLAMPASPPDTEARLSSAKRQTILPHWSLNPPPASLDRNVERNRVSGLQMLASSDPGHNPPKEHGFLDDEDDKGPLPPPSDPDGRPISTGWLVSGNAKYGDIPTATPASSMTIGLERWSEPPAPAAQSIPDTLADPCAGKPRDWYDSRGVMLLGGLVFVLWVVMTAELGRVLFRKFKRDRQPMVGRVRMQGGEKRLLAYANFSHHNGASSFPAQLQP